MSSKSPKPFPVLPDDVLRIILDTLAADRATAALASFSGASRAFRHLALPALYRDVVVPRDPAKMKILVHGLTAGGNCGLVRRISVPSQGYGLELLVALPTLRRLKTLKLEFGSESQVEMGLRYLAGNNLDSLSLAFTRDAARPDSFCELPMVRNLEIDVVSVGNESAIWSYLARSDQNFEWSLNFRRARSFDPIGALDLGLGKRLVRLHLECEELPLFNEVIGLDIKHLTISRGLYQPEDEGLRAFEPPRIRRAWLQFAAMEKLEFLELRELPSNTLMIRRIPPNLKRLILSHPSPALRPDELNEVAAALCASRVERVEIITKSSDWTWNEHSEKEKLFWLGLDRVRFREV